MDLLLLSVASVGLAGPASAPLVVCTPPKPTVVRTDPRFDSPSLGVLEPSSCGVTVRAADLRSQTAAEPDTWMYVEKHGGPSGWAFVPSTDAAAWKRMPGGAPAGAAFVDVARVARTNMLGIVTSNLAYTVVSDTIRKARRSTGRWKV